MKRDQIAKLHATVEQFEARQRFSVMPTKAQRDALVAAAMAEGRWPSLDGLNEQQRGAVSVARRAYV